MSVPFFDALDEVSERLRRSPYVLVFCDFEGLAFGENNQACSILHRLAETQRATIVLVSGKPQSEVHACMDVPNLAVMGNFGLEVSVNGEVYTEPSASNAIPALHEIAEQFQKLPVHIEDRGLSLRITENSSEDHVVVRDAIHSALASASHPFALTPHQRGYDIRPRVYWDKSSAVAHIRERSGHPEADIVYIGGHPTDEDAFAAFPDAVSLHVGAGSETRARYTLEDADGVIQVLEWLTNQLSAQLTPHERAK